jgi:hypothetical protein
MSRPTIPAVTVLKSAGLGVSAGLLSGIAPAVASETAEIWAHEYWANKDGVKLNLWRKRVGALPGETGTASCSSSMVPQIRRALHTI